LVHKDDTHTDGRMDGHIDMKKLIVTFCKFANAPKKYEKRIMRRIDRAHYHNTSIYLQWGGDERRGESYKWTSLETSISLD